ncbi:MAG TPA: hypothetical protein VKS20_09145 [Candidatus Acidoferrales bacterium]|nr:hypothetical protein [Candidatus Acidoferrales bacterium]
MIRTRRLFEFLLGAITLLAGMLISAPAAFAQGCALCYNDASATGPQAEAALRHGILILLIPPMLIFSGLFGMLYRRRNAHHEASRLASSAGSMSASSEFVLHLD